MIIVSLLRCTTGRMGKSAYLGNTLDHVHDTTGNRSQTCGVLSAGVP